VDRTIVAASSLIACIALAGCGGGDSSGFIDNGGGGGGGGPPPPTTTQFVAPSDISFVDAIDPSNPVLHFSPTLGTYAGKRLFTTGTVVPGQPMLSNQAGFAQIYKDSGGHLYRLNLSVTGSPTATQVSSEANATIDDLCSLNGANVSLGTDANYLAVQFYNDFANPENSVYFYRLPGPDGVCNTSDDVVYMVKLGMGSTDAPVLARMPIAVVHDPASGAIKGYVVNEGSALTLYDANFQSRTVLETPASPITTAYALANSGFTATGGLFVVDGNIVHIDYVADSVSASLFTVPNWTPTTRFTNSASLTTLYFAVDTSDRTQTPVTLTSSLYSMPLDGSAVAGLLASESGIINGVTFPVGGTATVAYAVVPPGGTYTIRAVTSAAGQAPSVVTAVTTSGNSGSFVATTTDIYYTVSTFSAPNSTTRVFSNTVTGIVGMDGTVVESPFGNSRFVAEQRDTNGSGWLNVIRARNLTPVSLVSSTNGLTYTEDGISGATLEVVDTANNAVTLTLGTLPAGTVMQGTGTLIGTSGYIDGFNVNSTLNPTTRELLYVDISTANSLATLTSNLH